MFGATVELILGVL